MASGDWAPLEVTLCSISDSPRKNSFFDGHSWVGYHTYVRLVREATETHRPRPIRGPADIYDTFFGLSECDRERFYSVHLDSQHQVCGLDLVTQGTLDDSLISPREVYKGAILSNAGALILLHNHPSGNPDPNPENRSVTKTLVESGKLLGIPVLDISSLERGGATASRRPVSSESFRWMSKARVGAGSGQPEAQRCDGGLNPPSPGIRSGSRDSLHSSPRS